VRERDQREVYDLSRGHALSGRTTIRGEQIELQCRKPCQNGVDREQGVSKPNDAGKP